MFAFLLLFNLVTPRSQFGFIFLVFRQLVLLYITSYETSSFLFVVKKYKYRRSSEKISSRLKSFLFYFIFCLKSKFHLRAEGWGEPVR
jgi:hypothetical protein